MVPAARNTENYVYGDGQVNSTVDDLARWARTLSRNALVSAQVALSLMLVVTAFLFLRSLANAAHTDPGFKTANIMLAGVDVSLSGYREQQAVELASRFRERLKAIPGVESVATAHSHDEALAHA